MSSLVYNYLHIVFSTKNREHLIFESFEELLYKHIIESSKILRSPIVAIGGTSDHIHLLVNLSKTISLSDYMKNIKGESSHWIQNNLKAQDYFYWQNGYAAFSVDYKNIYPIKNYIARQKEHHKDLLLEEELKLLRNHKS